MANPTFYYESIEDTTLTASSEATDYPKENLQDRNENTKWKDTYTELVTNGGFEAGTTSPPANWTNSLNHTGTALADGTAPEGSNVCEIVATGGGGGGLGYFAQQSLSLSNDAYYEVSFYAKTISGNTSLQVELWGGSGGSHTIDGTWTKYTRVMQASTSPHLFFWLNGAGTCRIDNVCLIRVPEITIDYGSGNTLACDYLVLGGHNIHTVSGKVYLYYSSDGSSWNEVSGTGAAPSSDDPYYFAVVIGSDYRYWKVRISEATAAVEIATIFLGTKFSHTVNIKEAGNKEGRMSGVELRETGGGQRFSNLNYALRRIWDLSWENIGETHHTNFFTWAENNENSNLPFYFDIGDGNLYLVRYMADNLMLSDVAYQLYNTPRIRLEQEL